MTSADKTRLAAFDALCAALKAEQAQLSEQLAALRTQGKEKSWQFKELMGKKLANSLVVSRLQASGLWPAEE